jgi:putative phage-type endonuclease
MLFPYFSDEELLELEESIHSDVEEYMSEHGLDFCKPEFYKTMIDTITLRHVEYFIDCGIINQGDDEHYKRFRKMFHRFAKNYFHMIGIRRRSYINPKPRHYNNNNMLRQVDHLKSLVLPEQRTPEWYQYRNNLITASNIWKAIGSEANKNSLIAEKCKPPVSFTGVNVDSSLHWGQKYEPVSVALYEHINQVKVHEFGCIAHRKYPFIGASPDGITENGRMIEIKNVVSREITGIPKMDYWVQMQVQLEVCDLEDCDFVETQFKEYDDHEEELFYKNKDKYDYNGLILYFIKSDFTDSAPHYVYMPLSIPLNKASINAWIQSQKELLQDSHILFRKLFWYCETYSCVLVKRNRIWFDMALPYFKDIWDRILQKREEPVELSQSKKWVVKKCMITVDNFDVDLGEPACEP